MNESCNVWDTFTPAGFCVIRDAAKVRYYRSGTLLSVGRYLIVLYSTMLEICAETGPPVPAAFLIATVRYGTVRYVR